MLEDAGQFEVFHDDYSPKNHITYQNNDEDIVELIHWEPVAKDVEFEIHILKLNQMKQFIEGR